jgi:hypothetical protein
MHKTFKVIVGLVTAYVVFCAAILAIMWQPPLRFAKAIAKVPGPMFLVLPFETLWSWARGGHLRPGDTAPDFDLEMLDHSARVRLSWFQGRKPVVLIFGSYT